MKWDARVGRREAMRRRHIELGVGLGLLLGPLGYALTLEPEVVEVVEVVEVAAQPIPTPSVTPEIIPTVEPPAESPTEPAPAVEVVPEPPPEGLLEFAFVNKAGLVLSTEAEAGWSKGRLRAHAGPAQFRAAKRANAETIPAALWAQRGRSFDLYGTDGKVCTARLGELSVLAQHDGPGLYEMYYPEADYYYYEADAEAAPERPRETYDEFEARPHPTREIRTKLWERATTSPDGTLWLVAELVSEQSCKGARWARDAELPAPGLLHRSEESSPLTEQRLAEYQASDKPAEAKAQYDEWAAEASEGEREYFGTWDTLDAEFPAKVRTWSDEQGTARFVELEAGYIGAGCGDGPDTYMTSLDAVVDGRFEPTEQAIRPIAIFDADLDGRYELLYHDVDQSTSHRLASGTMGQSWQLDYEPYCPC